LADIDWLFGMAHSVQTVDCCVGPTMFDEFFNGNRKIAFGLIGIGAGLVPIFTLVPMKPFNSAIPCFLGEWQACEKLTYF
jgi:hypothetical protein